jgi:hypothetical protein
MVANRVANKQQKIKKTTKNRLKSKTKKPLIFNGFNGLGERI